jgi:predicted ribosome quality control (RQC) complex YloA/Tae2 family protein
MKMFNFNNINIVLGTNAKENFQLIDDANPNDWWFHLDDYPSGHCIVKHDVLDREIIEYAGRKVKENSKLKNEMKVVVIYTQIKNIRKTKTVGEVILLKPVNKTVIRF